MRTLVTGATGQLGFDCVKLFKENNLDVLGVSSKDFNLCEKEITKNFILEYSPDIIVHCAAYTDVDKAESDAGEVATFTNIFGTNYIIDVCEQLDIPLIFISSDFVYAGSDEILVENVQPNPLNYYGTTKWISERRIREHLDKYFIIRTSWLCGVNGNNFVKTMLKLAKKRYKQIDVVDDQLGSPTFTKDLSKLILSMLNSNKYGVYNATNEGFVSKADFAQAIFDLIGCKTKINRVSTEEYNQKNNIKTKRPLNNRLSKDKLEENGFEKLPYWLDSLKEYLKEIK